MRVPEAAPTPPNSSCWRVLVVDDEDDVHRITRLALQRRTWRRRSFELMSCHTARETRELLRQNADQSFHVALVDVVMETKSAGLELCRYLRTELPSSLRIILRTGQAGVAPEEQVINDYDIDHYMSKSEMTPHRLFSTIRSCLRSSQDIDTLIAFNRQLRRFASALLAVDSGQDLAVFMNQGLRFIELKNQVRIFLVKDIEGAPSGSAAQMKAFEVVARGHRAELAMGRVLPADALGLEFGHVVLFAVPVQGSGSSVRGGFVIEGAEPFMLDTLYADLNVFLESWTTTQRAMVLQQRVAREKLLYERMHMECTQSIATMVIEVADELDVPLSLLDGVPASVAEGLSHAESSDVGAVVERAMSVVSSRVRQSRQIIRNFKEHALGQLSDDVRKSDVRDVMLACVELMSASARKHKVTIRTKWREGQNFPWVGVPGHLAHVLVNLLQNAIRYAYHQEDGIVDLRLADDPEAYRIECEDYGVGLPTDPAAAPLQTMFEPANLERGGGLAVAHHIVTRLLGGQIRYTTVPAKGTKFILTIPRQIKPTSHPPGPR
jgi:signal transduction histidine kinase